MWDLKSLERWLDYDRDGVGTESTLGPAVSPTDAQSTAPTHGDVLTAISDGIVALLKEFYGRGPTRTKSYYQDDLVVCLLRGGFTRVEQTLLEGGRGSVDDDETPGTRAPFGDLTGSGGT